MENNGPQPMNEGEAAAAAAQQQQAAAAAAQHQQQLFNDLFNRQAQTEGVLQAIQQQLAAGAAAAPNPVQVPSSAVEARKPDFFKGTTAEAASCRLWVLSVDTYFDTVAYTDHERLVFAAALLRGDALLWWNGLTAKPTTYPDFKTALVDYFQPVSAQMLARDEMATLSQHGSVKAYTTAFKRCLTNIPDMVDPERMDKYYRGLKRDIRIQVALSRVTTFDAMVEVAERTDVIMFQGRRSFPRPPPGRFAPRSAGGAVPMDLGAVNFRPNGARFQPKPPQQQRRTYAQVAVAPRRFPRLTPEERERLRENNGCFYCRGTGHFMSECPLKQRGHQRAAPRR
jgi:hypothetical protein